MVALTKKSSVTKSSGKKSTSVSNSNSSNSSSNKVKPVGFNKKNVDNKKPLLSEEIMDIVNGASNIKKSIDPESMDYFGDSAKVDDYEDFGDIQDDNSGSRLRGDIDSGFTTGKYSGKKASRKNENSDEDDNQGELDSDGESDKDLDDVFDFDNKQEGSDDGDDSEEDDNIVHSSNIDKADQLFKKLQQQQQSNEKESREPKLLNITNEADEMEKAKNTKNQTILYNEFLTTRIYLQKAINFANRLPKATAYKEFCEYDESIKSKFGQVKKASYELVSGLYDLQHELIEKNDEIPKSIGKKRIREELSLSEVWNIIDEQNQRLNEFHNATITKWNNRISITGTSSSTTTHNKSLKSLNQSILTQINNTLNDIERLQKRTKLKRSTYKIFGDNNNNNNNNNNNSLDNSNNINTLDENDQDEYDDEIFDDTDFYQNLLRELENSADDDSNKVGSQYWIEMKNLKKKKKKKVNQKASKGRILRYEVFPKLENFMTPIQVADPDWNIDQLYQNLFGGIGNK